MYLFKKEKVDSKFQKFVFSDKIEPINEQERGSYIEVIPQGIAHMT
jgi:hypothetical protein